MHPSDAPEPQATTARAAPRSALRRLWRRVLALCIGVGLSLVLLELTCAVSVSAGWIAARTPTYSLERTAATFWADIDPDFGVWHYANIEFRHAKACFDVRYRSNSYGARDVERALAADPPRVVVLGDSFMEGYGMELEDRMSNVLEHDTAVPHLNFGTSGNAGPTHAFVLYRALASQFEHTAVLAAILPENDFEDDLPRPGRYQPYWAGAYPDYHLEHTLGALADSDWSASGNLESITFDRVLREFTYTRNVWDLLYTSFKHRRAQNRGEGTLAIEPSRFFDYTPEEFDRLRYSYEQLAALAAPRPVVLFTIPRLADLVAFARERRSPLDEQLGAWADTVDNVHFVPLMPELSERFAGHFEDMFLPCDAHWDTTGHRAAAEIVRDAFGTVLYPR